MLRLHQIFFINFLTVFAGTLLLSGAISYFSLKQSAIQRAHDSLLQTVDFVAYELTSSPAQNIDAFVVAIKEHTQIRATLIDESGKVIAESHKDKEHMGNHAMRAEIIQARKEGRGSSVRYSLTLKTDFIYVAKKLQLNDKEMFLRLSKSLEFIIANFVALWIKISLLFAISILVGLYINYKTSRRIANEVDKLNYYVDEISQKNYRAQLKSGFSLEFINVGGKLKKLVQKLQKRDRQRQKHTARLRLINKQRNAILSAISHEFKNPIASIIGYAQTLQERKNTNPEIEEKFFNKIISNAEKISLMLDRLSLSVALEHNDIPLKKEIFDLLELAQEAVANIGKKYRERHISIEGKSTFIMADKTLIEIVIINLLDNALKYSEEEVSVTLNSKALMVQDRGIGVEPKHIQKITGRFYRINTNRWDNSMGLGLAIVKEILKAHDEELSINSKPKEGSTFGFSYKRLLAS